MHLGIFEQPAKETFSTGKQGKETRVNPRNIQAIARKEIYHLLRDFRSLYLAFAIPLPKGETDITLGEI